MAKKKEIDERGLRQLATYADYKATFNSPHGRNVLKDLMQNCSFNRTTFVEKDPYAMAFNEGGRAVVLTIIQRLKMNLQKLEENLLERQGEIDV